MCARAIPRRRTIARRGQAPSLRTNTENRNHTQSHGTSRTPSPTNKRKAATNNRNFASSNRRVLAPGRGQCVRSWILKGALAKRSRKARTQAPLSRAPRPGSSGTFLLLFWSQKRRAPVSRPIKKGRCRMVATPGKAAIKSSETLSPRSHCYSRS